MNAKKLVFEGGAAMSPIGTFGVWTIDGSRWRAEREISPLCFVTIGGHFPTEEEGKAACQKEFDRIYARMSGNPWRPISEWPPGTPQIFRWNDGNIVTTIPSRGAVESGMVVAFMPVPPYTEQDTKP